MRKMGITVISGAERIAMSRLRCRCRCCSHGNILIISHQPTTSLRTTQTPKVYAGLAWPASLLTPSFLRLSNLVFLFYSPLPFHQPEIARKLPGKRERNYKRNNIKSSDCLEPSRVIIIAFTLTHYYFYTTT